MIIHHERLYLNIRRRRNELFSNATGEIFSWNGRKIFVFFSDFKGACRDLRVEWNEKFQKKGFMKNLETFLLFKHQKT